MRDIRLIATDLDGTLMDRDAHMGSYTRRTLEECLRRGITVMIVSGRCHQTARLPALEARLDLVVASANGARIDQTPYGPTLFERRMTRAECAAVYNILRDCPGNIYSYIRGVNLVRRRRSEFDPTAQSLWIGAGDDLAEVAFDDVARFESEGLEDVHKFEIYEPDPALLADYAARLEAIGMAVTQSSWQDIEIQPRDSTKGLAVRWMARRLGVAREQIMCFGDYTNDKSMLREAGIGVAMANAVPELRAAADMIAPPNAFEGEARCIRRVVFGEEDVWPNIAAH